MQQLDRLPALVEMPATLSFAAGLARFGDAIAVVTPEDVPVSYRELAGRVADVGVALGCTRRLVLVEASNELGALVAYLAALAGGHPVLLVPATDDQPVRDLVAAYDPDVVCAADGAETLLTERRIGTAHELHPDLCVLLSTSGSTGSPKLVRLSHTNIESNAEAIATYLSISASDCAATTLPMAYCYGLSVVNSYLTRGATLLLSNDSVIEPRFWERFRAHKATSFAGVPYTFELLDRVGFATMDLPSLRYVTQAGGRLAPERVRAFAELAAAGGWDFFVMYGQTEATARMAYMPPEHLLANPGAIGFPIPGGEFALEPVDGASDGEGELVYRGPNVMLGYATRPADLARGRTIDALHTGDIARRNLDGCYEIVGRKGRFIKPFGLRIDLDHLERMLAAVGHDALCTGNDDVLVVALPNGFGDKTCSNRSEIVAKKVRLHTGLPDRCVRVCTFDDVPRVSNGKPDYRAILTAATATEPAPQVHASNTGAIFAAVLGRNDVTEHDTFVSLDGDSLSYVEASLWIEESLGYLPDQWHLLPVAELDQLSPQRRWWRSVETGVVLRALAIFLVVAAHVGWISLQGGAHALLAIAGYNFARFALAPRSGPRLRRDAVAIGRVAIPTIIAIALTVSIKDYPGLGKRVFLSNYIDPTVWRYWFVEVLVHVLIVLAVLFSIPSVRRRERAHPYGFALAAFLATAAVGYAHIAFGSPANPVYQSHIVVFVFVLGWLVYRSTTTRQRVLVSVLTVVTIVPFFEQLSRVAVVVGAILLLTWVPRVRVPAPLHRVFGAIAAASLYIYLTHFEVYRGPLGELPAPIVVAIAIAVGLLTWQLVRAVSRAAGRVRLPARFSAGRDEELFGHGVGHEVFAGRRLHAHAGAFASDHGGVRTRDEAGLRDQL